MSRISLNILWAVFILGLFTLLCMYVNLKFAKEAKAKKSIPNVFTVAVTEDSYYVIDKRYNLCFYHVETSYIATATKIDCDELKVR